MPSRRLAAALAPLIALVLIGGVIAAVMGGSDTPGTDFAQQPAEPEPSASAEPGADAEPSPTAEPGTEPSPDGEPAPDTGAGPAPESSPGSDGATPSTSEQAVPPAVGPTPMPEPSASPAGVPGGTTPAVQDPTALTGGWEGGTPNTGTAISAAGLLLLVLGGGLLWLRRSRT